MLGRGGAWQGQRQMAWAAAPVRGAGRWQGGGGGQERRRMSGMAECRGGGGVGEIQPVEGPTAARSSRWKSGRDGRGEGVAGTWCAGRGVADGGKEAAAEARSSPWKVRRRRDPAGGRSDRERWQGRRCGRDLVRRERGGGWREGGGGGGEI
uniref:Uncharacterized protein n=1 Tax=Setaria viridis TaxID=4556 RepID=A0A4U6W352_SETVI|nr:LOW QUALITY PROTEIN: hypothetical protein SEVIR_2G395950v2 [Setaria viridis]